MAAGACLSTDDNVDVTLPHRTSACKIIHKSVRPSMLLQISRTLVSHVPEPTQSNASEDAPFTVKQPLSMSPRERLSGFAITAFSAMKLNLSPQPDLRNDTQSAVVASGCYVTCLLCLLLVLGRSLCYRCKRSWSENDVCAFKGNDENPMSISTPAERSFVDATNAYTQAKRAGEIRVTRDVDSSLYSLYKQATVGDLNVPRPSAWRRKSRARWQAWSALQGMGQAVAMERYARLVEDIRDNESRKQSNLWDEHLLAAAPQTHSRLRTRFDEAIAKMTKIVDEDVVLFAPDEMLSLYGLFHQAIQGDVRGKRPQGTCYKEQDLWDAWSRVKGTSCRAAMEAYVGVADRVCERLAHERLLDTEVSKK
eukprot:TRINITY_DN48452_c0_g1_i1.p1 TRINITY_DN48452_c0_g1~~TRINITY_DN48452_c0_g1_i1.p1  ORF type:complete len:420 (+),score=43.24 TRINITY_DN48452_c0_g1_i1:163-1260(+)